MATIMGQREYRAWVGFPDYYDRLGAIQFVMLMMLGMRERDNLLDIGCGSLRGGRFSLLYLNEGRYCGIEPESWCLEQSVAAEIGHDLIRIKKPSFSHNADFRADQFGRQFQYAIAGGIFMHTCRKQMDACFEAVARVLAPDGIFLGPYLPGDADSDASCWTYPEIQYFRPATLVEGARRAGLALIELETPHPLDHRWFAAIPINSRRRFRTTPDLAVFSWQEYLIDQIRTRGGSARSYEDYLKRDLRPYIEGEEETVVPQART